MIPNFFFESTALLQGRIQNPATPTFLLRIRIRVKPKASVSTLRSDRASSYTCPAGGGLREVCAAVARGRRLLWGLVHLNGLHWNLLGHCPTYETQRLTCALSYPATTAPSILKHPHAQNLTHCSPIPITIFCGCQKGFSCPESWSPGASTLCFCSSLLFPSYALPLSFSGSWY